MDDPAAPPARPRSANAPGAFADAHEQAAQWLVAAGLDRATARALVALAVHGEATTPDLERRAGLRQSESSLATMRLKARGWTTLRSVRRPGRGRPTNVHALARPLRDILAEYAREAKDPGALLDVERLLAPPEGPEPI